MEDTMKKTFKIEVDCANCARKVEEAIAKIDGVIGVSVNFLAEKITIEANDAVFDDVLKKAKKTAKKVEPDCVISDL